MKKVAKSIYKNLKIKENYVSLKSKIKISNNTNVDNIYHATIQKTASQWVKAIFSDNRIKKITGLETFPQHRYEWDDFYKKFPKYTFVPGLYISYQLYEEINKPNEYRTFYIIRDPRNLVVSWYYSMLETHGLMGKVPKHRNNLKSLSFEEGITYCIKALHLKFSFMRSWIYNQEDPNVLIVKFEDLTKEPLETYNEIFKHCEYEIPTQTLKDVLDNYSKEKMRKKDLKQREDNKSHYRKKKTDWREVFTEEHLDLFYKQTGNLVELLGYDK